MQAAAPAPQPTAMNPDALLLATAVVGVANLVVITLVLWRLPRRAGAAGERAEQVLREELRAVREESARAARELREESGRAARELREEVGQTLRGTSELLVATVAELATGQRAQLEEIGRQVQGLTERNQVALDGVRGAVTAQLMALSETVQGRLDAARNTVDARLAQLQERNEAKLEEMRRTVDEQLQGTLEKRLGESFQIVSGNLEAVFRGLGEMRALAAGVGDLKRVLTNVKTRGTWAEVQLGALLEQILTPEQFARNVRVKEGSEERVEFAVRLPGRGGSAATAVWLPIDSKFPQEPYLRLLEASEAADPERVAAALAELARTVRLCARTIQEKYVAPPETTDFAVLFLPTEGLYAEVLRQSGLVEQLQESWRVVVAGPTTLAALLSSLRMGFKTLAIEQRASEVWQVLGAVKTEFGKFGDVLDKVKRQLSTASRTLTETGVRTRAMARKLREVEELPADVSSQLLELPEGYVQLDLLDEEAASADPDTEPPEGE
jgi:DNA recombination protein RmuC